jgi:dTMP kinase
MTLGRYIMLEGGEGCGKDLHAKLLADYLQSSGYKTLLTKEPGGTPEGEKIRELLLDKGSNLDSLEELFLFGAAGASSYRNIVIPSLEQGKVVVKTRGWPSRIVYQGYAGEIDLNLINRLNTQSTRGIKPDLLVVIDVPPEKGLEKETDPDRFAGKGLEFHRKVNNGYLAVVRNNQSFSVVVDYIENGIDEMQEKIRNHVKEKLSL